MEDTMNISVMQYLDGIRTYMRDKQSMKQNERLDMLGSQLLDEVQDDIPNFEFDNNNEIPLLESQFDAYSAKLFDDKMSLQQNREVFLYDIDKFKYEEMKDEADSIQDDISQSLHNDQKLSKDDRKQKKTDHKPNKRQLLDEDKNDNQKVTLSGKERAKRARERKKKYYDDLEEKVVKLVTENTQLKEELQYFKNRLQLLSNVPDNNDKKAKFQTNLFDSCIKMIEQIPETDVDWINDIKNMSSNFEPYGCWQVKLIDASFDSVIESLLSQGCKHMLYVCDKDRPKTKDEYFSYRSLKKFEKHEKYPDEYVRHYIDHILEQNLTDEQHENIEVNFNSKVCEIKKGLQEGIKLLFEAKDFLWAELMRFDILKRTVMPSIFTKESLIAKLKAMKSTELKIPSNSVFDIQSVFKDCQYQVEINDLELFKNALKSIPVTSVDAQEIKEKMNATYHIKLIESLS